MDRPPTMETNVVLQNREFTPEDGVLARRYVERHTEPGDDREEILGALGLSDAVDS